VKETGKLSFLINWEERRIKKEILLKNRDRINIEGFCNLESGE
jgi:hypothetical protein